MEGAAKGSPPAAAMPAPSRRAGRGGVFGLLAAALVGAALLAAAALAAVTAAIAIGAGLVVMLAARALAGKRPAPRPPGSADGGETLEARQTPEGWIVEPSPQR